MDNQKAPSNNYDTLRLLAALAVMLSHSFTLMGAGHEPFVDLSHRHTALGNIAVIVFFSISGFLITKSFDKSRDWRVFVWHRALRIYPALIVVLLACAFVLGPLVSSLAAGDYFRSREPYTYAAANLAFQTRYYLPGVFDHTPYKQAVNGSLWTLAPEVACYGWVLALGVTRLLRKWVVTVLAVAATLMLAFHPQGHDKFLMLLCPFLAGATFYLHDLKPRGLIALVAFALCAGALIKSGFHTVAAWAGTYVVLYVAQSPRVKLPRLPGRLDPSYGLYVWAFPVQQTVALFFTGKSGWLPGLAITFVVTSVLAVASFVLVERPMLRLKDWQPWARK